MHLQHGIRRLQRFHLELQKLQDQSSRAQQLQSKIEELIVELENIKTKQKLLDGIPCGDIYPSCKFIKDAHIAVATKELAENDRTKAETELEDLLQGNRLYSFKDTATDFIKRVTGRETDSFNVRETGKFISELINQIKQAYEVKE